MKTLMIASLLLAASSVGIAQENKPEQKQKIAREGIEWCDVWIPSASKTDNPRVLLVGDSITKGYYNSVCKNLGNKASCARFATSACVADPAFLLQLEAIISQYKFDVIHVNNGLHGIDYTEEEYRVGYEKALKLIKKEAPDATLILALSTPLKKGSNKAYLNPRIDERNKIVNELAKTCGATVNDLHAISKGHPEYYKDPYHYKGNAIELQAKQVAEKVLEELKSKSKKPADK